MGSWVPWPGALQSRVRRPAITNAAYRAAPAASPWQRESAALEGGGAQTQFALGACSENETAAQGRLAISSAGALGGQTSVKKYVKGPTCNSRLSGIQTIQSMLKEKRNPLLLLDLGSYFLNRFT